MIFRQHPPKRYELWQSADGCSTTYFAEENAAARATLEAGATMIWSCEATSYVDAMKKQHVYLGFEPYKPPADWSDE